MRELNERNEYRESKSERGLNNIIKDKVQLINIRVRTNSTLFINKFLAIKIGN